jgi:hypothetical protein
VLERCKFGLGHCRYEPEHCRFGLVHCRCEPECGELAPVHCRFGLVHCRFGLVHCRFGLVHCRQRAHCNFVQVHCRQLVRCSFVQACCRWLQAGCNRRTAPGCFVLRGTAWPRRRYRLRQIDSLKLSNREGELCSSTIELPANELSRWPPCIA